MSDPPVYYIIKRAVELYFRYVEGTLEWNNLADINSSGDEITNVNFLRRYRTRTSEYQKRQPTSFNKLDDSSASTSH